ncbi:MAG: hypothetical protein WCO00_14080 [Rhodospirillaceae bacterium]
MTTHPIGSAQPYARLNSAALRAKPSAEIQSLPVVAEPAPAKSGPSAPLAAFASDSATQAGAALTQAVKQGRSVRSGKALERLHQLVNQARLMRQIMVGGDPKTVARLARDLAKQIADAAKEYAANAEPGGQDAAAAAGATGAAGTAPAAPVNPVAAEADSSVRIAAHDAADAEAALPKGGAGPEASKAATEARDVSAVKTETDGAVGAGGNAAPKPDAVAVNAEKGAALFNRLGGADDGRARAIAKERELIQEVKNTLSALRAVAERAAKRMGQHHEASKEFDHADKEVEQAERTIGQHDEGGPGGGQADAAPDRAASVGSTVNMVT